MKYLPTLEKAFLILHDARSLYVHVVHSVDSLIHGNGRQRRRDHQQEKLSR
jgi:hypothetical protein